MSWYKIDVNGEEYYIPVTGYSDKGQPYFARHDMDKFIDKLDRESVGYLRSHYEYHYNAQLRAGTLSERPMSTTVTDGTSGLYVGSTTDDTSWQPIGHWPLQEQERELLNSMLNGPQKETKEMKGTIDTAFQSKLVARFDMTEEEADLFSEILKQADWQSKMLAGILAQGIKDGWTEKTLGYDFD
jgi:hypothetical protein